VDAKIIKLENNGKIPEIHAREGAVLLSFNSEEHDEIEISGTITVSEVCYLKEVLCMWIHNKMQELRDAENGR
jgi:hypothetical protein